MANPNRRNRFVARIVPNPKTPNVLEWQSDRSLYPERVRAKPHMGAYSHTGRMAKR